MLDFLWFSWFTTWLVSHPYINTTGTEDVSEVGVRLWICELLIKNFNSDVFHQETPRHKKYGTKCINKTHYLLGSGQATEAIKQND